MSLSTSLVRASLLIAAFALLASSSVRAQDFTDGTGVRPEGPLAFNSGTVEAPSLRGGSYNDVLIQSISISFPNTVANGNSSGATAEGSDNPSASCTFNGPDNDGDNSVWWWFVPTSNGNVTIDMDGSGFDTILTILDSSLNEVACNDDDPNNGPGDFSSRIENAPVSANTAYFVRITGFNGEEGAYTFNFEGPVTGPANDNFWLRIRDDIANYPGDNRSATSDAGELSASCSFQGTGNDGNNSVWRRFTAPTNGMISISVVGGSLDAILSITNAARSTELACADVGADGDPETLSDFAVTAGTTYDIRVSGWQGSESTFDYTFGFSPAVANEPTADLPSGFALGAAYPNPFNPSTSVPFTLAQDGDVRLAVFDALGREVAVLAEGRMAAGSHSATFEATDLPSGAYLVRLSVEGGAQSQTVTLLK